MLAQEGIEPLNGWISDYPMTPQIIGQLNDSLVKAAAGNRIPITAQEATQRLYVLTAELNLAAPAGPSSAAPAAQANPNYVDEYYYYQGPPVVTYYPPPVDYAYLYDWVPYPVVWFGFSFPGFFICHNFTTTVIVTNTRLVTRTGIVTNRIINPDTRTVVRVDPVVRTSTGTIRPETALRTENDEMFKTFADVRQGVNMAGVSAMRPGTLTNAALKTQGFRYSGARESAQAIVTRSDLAANSHIASGFSSRRQIAAPAAPARTFRPVAPPVMHRGFAPMRPSSGNGWHGRG